MGQAASFVDFISCRRCLWSRALVLHTLYLEELFDSLSHTISHLSNHNNLLVSLLLLLLKLLLALLDLAEPSVPILHSEVSARLLLREPALYSSPVKTHTNHLDEYWLHCLTLMCLKSRSVQIVLGTRSSSMRDKSIDSFTLKIAPMHLICQISLVGF